MGILTTLRQPRSRASRKRSCGSKTGFSALVLQLEERTLLTVGTIGADGWTNLTPSADSRVIYVSSSGGNDSNNGLSEAAPVATIGEAVSLARSGYPDWILLKHGDEFGADTNFSKSGRSAAEPIVLSGYGEGVRPIINGKGFKYWGANGGPDFSMNYVAITGFEFRGNGLGGKAINFAGGLSHILIENNSFSGYGTASVHIQNIDESVPEEVSIRRNVVSDADGQGILIQETSGLLLEENTFDHNGYSGEGPNLLRHNVYLTKVHDLIARGNIFARGSNFGLKMATNDVAGFTNFVVDNNLFFNNGVSMDASSGIPLGITTYRHQNGLIENNVFTELGRTFASGSKQDLAAWMRNTELVHWDSNFFVHKAPLANNPMLSWGNNERHKDITIENSVVYDWDLGEGRPPTRYFENNAYQESPLVGVTNLQLINNQIDLPAASYVDPTRTVGSYYASIGGQNDAVAFLQAAREMSKANWNPAFMADAVNDYIRDGFTLAATAFTAPRSGGALQGTNSNQISWDVQFSVPVAGVDASDFQLNFTPGSVTLTDAGDADPATYVLTAIGVPEGTLRFAGVIESSGITDLSGNDLDPERQGTDALHQFVVDRTAPTPVISMANSGTNPNSTVTINFAEPVTDFDAADLTITNGTVSNFATIDSAVYTFVLSPVTDDRVTIDIADAVAVDLAGNTSAAATVTGNITDNVRFVDNGDLDYLSTGMSANVGYGFQNDVNYASGGNGSSTATWTFRDLAPGNYQVSTTWAAHPNRASDAPYALSDGTNAPVVFDLDQRQAPSGVTDAGVKWQILTSSFSVSGSTLVVELSNDADGYVIADAIRIQPALVGPQIDVTGHGVSIAVGDTTPSETDFTDFGASSVARRDFTIHNTGDLALAVSSVSVAGGDAGDFSVLNAPSSVAAGETATIQVLFTAGGLGLRSTTLSIVSNDGDDGQYDIALQATGTTGQIVDNGPPDYVSTGMSANVGYGFQNDVNYAGGGSGSSTATWTFRDLAPGDYQVSTTWAAHPNRASDAPYTLSDGTNAPVVFDLDQRQAPSGVTDAGVNWQILTSSFSVSGSTLVVELSNDADGYVIADAIRIQPVLSLPSAIRSAAFPSAQVSGPSQFVFDDFLADSDIDDFFADPLLLNL